MADNYRNFEELARSEAPGTSWRIETIDRADSEVLIVAPHGGGIEPGTSQLAAAIAGEDYSLYCFEGVKSRGNGVLHITSHHFDEPTAVALAERSAIVVGVHGCQGDEAIYVGGLDIELVGLITDGLVGVGLPASDGGHDFPAKHPLNICNRGSRLRGAQIEATRDLRSAEYRPLIARAVRGAIRAHQKELERLRRGG